jgi:ferric-dicitrate binding protein FerR (iron transport regulator)
MENNQEQYEKASLILRYLRGGLTPKEEEELEHWLDAAEQNRVFFEKLKEERELEQELSFFTALDTEKAWQRIASQTIEKDKAISLWRRNTAIWKYAAVIALMLAAALSFYYTQIMQHPAANELASTMPEQQVEEIVPGGDKAKLTFSDGSVFLLEDMANGTVREENGVKVSKQEGQVTFEIAGNSSSQVFFNTISTPVGGQYQVILPDGTKVWLNSASTLYFPSAFVKNERVVELTGEGYFEVSKNRQKPFKVKVNEAVIEVLGTHFNIMAYANERYLTTTLLEGSVKVNKGSKSQLMVPGQQARIGEDILLRNVDVEEAVAWKNGLFYFHKADIATIMRQLERWYGIEAAYSGEISSKHFSGIISRDTEIDKVLEMLSLTKTVRFKTEGRRIVVTTI